MEAVATDARALTGSGPVANSMASVFGFQDRADQLEDRSRLVAALIGRGHFAGLLSSAVPLVDPPTGGCYKNRVQV